MEKENSILKAENKALKKDKGKPKPDPEEDDDFVESFEDYPKIVELATIKDGVNVIPFVEYVKSGQLFEDVRFTNLWSDIEDYDDFVNFLQNDVEGNDEAEDENEEE